MQDLIKLINDQQSSISKYYRLIDIFEGNLTDYVAQSLAVELTPESYNKAITRIPAINLLRRIVKKLSKVYTDSPPKRTTLDPRDQQEIESLVKSIDLQNQMSKAEDLLNLQKCCALEPYLENRSFKLRVLGPHEFTVISNDPQNPLNITHFIKYMGSYKKDEKTQANIYWIYTDQFFIVADSDGEILDSRENPYQVIPFVYINSSQNFLKPKPDNDSFNNTVLIPKLLSDLNYATQFQSHSIMYSIDAEINGKATASPDAMWNLISKEGATTTPQVGVLSPSVDTDKVLSLISFTVSQWLESRGIKASSVGSLNAANVASGVSKIIDEADASQVIQENRLILVEAEQRLWSLIGIMHNTLIGTEELNASRGFTEPLEVSISFPEQKPIPDPQEKRNDLKFKLENKLISYIRALKQANPDLTDDEILKLKAEIEKETLEATPPQLRVPQNNPDNNQNLNKDQNENKQGE